MTNTQKELFDSYKEFVLSHTIPDGEIKAKDELHIMLSSPYAEGTVNAYDLDNLDTLVIELCVKKVKDDNVCFYLHFELRDIEYAKELFTEMLGSYIALKKAGKNRILLCCTSAFTTTYFANKLNETADYLSLPFEFSAVSYDQVLRVAFDYDMVLLAPQAAFYLDSVKRIYDDIPVINVPPAVFAAYDATGLIETVRRELNAFKAAAPQNSISIENNTLGQSDKNILSMAIISNQGRTQIAYRVYEKGVPGKENIILKGRLDLVRDICDIMDTAVYLNAEYDLVSISLPGIIDNGHVMLDAHISPNVNLVEILEEKYNVPVILVKDINAAATGLAASKKDIGSAAFFFIPDGGGNPGIGLCINGKPYTGSHCISGEMQFITRTLFQNNSFFASPGDIDNLSLPTATLYTTIIAATMDPDMICICSRKIPDINEITDSVKKNIPEKYIPTITTCSEKEMKEYMLLGGMLSADSTGN